MNQDDLRMPGSGNIWQNRSFLLLFAGEGISALGDAVTMTAIPLIVIQETGSGTQVGIVALLQFIPQVAFCLLAGALADRWNRRRMMLASNVGRALLTALIPLASILGRPVVPLLYLVAVPLGLLSAMFAAGYQAALPSLVRKEQLGTAAGYVNASVTLGYIMGPALAGALAHTLGAGTTMAIDAMTFLVSVTLLAFLRVPAHALDSVKPSILGELWEGVAFTFRQPSMRVLTSLVLLESVASAPLVTAITVHVVRHGMSSAVLGTILSAGGLGAATGYALGGKLAHGRAKPVLLGSLAGAGLVNLFIGHFTSPLPLIAGVFLSSALNASFLSVNLALRLTLIPDELQGRAGSTMQTFAMAAMGIGTLLGGALIDWTSGASAIRASGAACILVGCAFARAAPYPEVPA
ncbi:MFS transporter [Pendulispora brunnea]|uniref:MFS transporter n=1 Tax=Pendulispora brunnea TaxID=2905690 RepID=A0ABZ2KNK2_9BACT